jgi:hypothetical protein
MTKMTKMARQGRPERGRLDLKGHGGGGHLVVVGTGRREEDRGGRRRDLRGRPFFGSREVG